MPDMPAVEKRDASNLALCLTVLAVVGLFAAMEGPKFASLGWAGLGLIAASVLGLAFAPLLVGSFVVGIGAMLHFGKKSTYSRPKSHFIIATALITFFMVVGMLTTEVDQSPPAQSVATTGDEALEEWDRQWREAKMRFAADPVNATIVADPHLVDQLQRAINTLHEVRPEMDHDELLRLARVVVLTVERQGTSVEQSEKDEVSNLPQGVRIIDPFQLSRTAEPGTKTREQPAKAIVDRNWFGQCPTGYTDHPSDPKKCALPWVVARSARR